VLVSGHLREREVGVTASDPDCHQNPGSLW
jgi:hypothetical protein